MADEGSDEKPGPSPEQVAALKAEHGDELRLVRVGGDAAVVRAPRRVEYKRFLDRSADAKGAERREAIEQLGRACVVRPTGAELDSLVERRAGLLTKAASVALELAALGDEAEVEKL